MFRHACIRHSHPHELPTPHNTLRPTRGSVAQHAAAGRNATHPASASPSLSQCHVEPECCELIATETDARTAQLAYLQKTDSSRRAHVWDAASQWLRQYRSFQHFWTACRPVLRAIGFDSFTQRVSDARAHE